MMNALLPSACHASHLTLPIRPASCPLRSPRSAGFTLIELIIVVGIISVLIAVMLTTFGGATESAKTTKCMTNMRNLAVAVQNCGMSSGNSDSSGYYPHAGSYEHLNITSGAKPQYHEVKGWISWKSTYLGKGYESARGGQVVTFDGAEEDVRFALTNGVLWTFTGASYETYRCPVHDAACRKYNNALAKRGPGWSYVMNQYFGFDSGYGSGAIPWESVGFGDIEAPDRRLLFAELPAIHSEVDATVAGLVQPVLNGSGITGDPTLQYEKSELVGFNHKAGKKWVGHMAFADGHVAKMFLPTSGSVKDLTEWLCQGYDIRYDGRQYTKVQNTSE